MKILILLIGFFFWIPLTAQAGQAPVVVELFSSQNCPACPEADRYMEHLIKQENLIALSCHVDYFGGQNDSLGKTFCTEKQTNYIRQIGRRSHYTPQMMINGHMDAIGYDTDTVNAAILKGRAENIKPIYIQSKIEGVYTIHLPSLIPRRRPVALWLAIYEKPHTLPVKGVGQLTYHNVISQIMDLGQWDGITTVRALAPLMTSTSAGFAVIAQDPSSGHILAAGSYER